MDSLQSSLTSFTTPQMAGAGAVGLADIASGNWRELATKLSYNYVAHWLAVQSGVNDMIVDTAVSTFGDTMGDVAGATALGVSGDIVAGQLRNILRLQF